AADSLRRSAGPARDTNGQSSWLVLLGGRAPAVLGRGLGVGGRVGLFRGLLFRLGRGAAGQVGGALGGRLPRALVALLRQALQGAVVGFRRHFHELVAHRQPAQQGGLLAGALRGGLVDGGGRLGLALGGRLGSLLRPRLQVERPLVAGPLLVLQLLRRQAAVQ